MEKLYNELSENTTGKNCLSSYIFHTFLSVVEIATAPAFSAATISSFSLMSPPAITLHSFLFFRLLAASAQEESRSHPDDTLLSVSEYYHMPWNQLQKNEAQ